jgi:hypothetical protein
MKAVMPLRRTAMPRARGKMRAMCGNNRRDALALLRLL